MKKKYFQEWLFPRLYWYLLPVMANANDFTVAQLLALANVDGKLNLLKKMKKATG
jgi:hypothetical protein